MRLAIITAASIGGLVAAASPLVAQESTVTPITGAKPYQAPATPGTPGEAPLSSNGAGPDSRVPGTRERGPGGTATETALDVHRL